MISDGKSLLVSNSGDNRTVINTVCSVLQDSWMTCKDIVLHLNQLSVYDACNSIFWYVVENVRYKEDPGNNQFVKTPARLLADGVGDCKSMAIFIASCLRCLNIPCVLRFVSFNHKPIYTHVYVVAYDKGDSIILDPVERVNGKPVFNYAQKYNLKKDIIC